MSARYKFYGFIQLLEIPEFLPVQWDQSTNQRMVVMHPRYQTIVKIASAPELLERRERLVAFVEEFLQSHDPETMCAEEIDLWIERLRPIRLELRAIDDQLRLPDA